MENNPFHILQNDSTPSLGHIINWPDLSGDPTERIKAILNNFSIVLFMKGTPDMPQCGFSANSIEILNHSGFEFHTYDILSDFELRESIKTYSQWPTFPQLYVKSELIGGNDILSELYESGELHSILSR